MRLRARVSARARGRVRRHGAPLPSRTPRTPLKLWLCLALWRWCKDETLSAVWCTARVSSCAGACPRAATRWPPPSHAPHHPLPSEDGTTKPLLGLSPEGQGHNLALTVLYVQHSLDSGGWHLLRNTRGVTTQVAAAGGRVHCIMNLPQDAP